MLKLKLQYFGHLIPRADSLEKTLMLRKIEGKKRRGRQRMRWLDSITDSMHMDLSKPGEIREAWSAEVHELDMTQPLNSQLINSPIPIPLAPAQIVGLWSASVPKPLSSWCSCLGFSGLMPFLHWSPERSFQDEHILKSVHKILPSCLCLIRNLGGYFYFPGHIHGDSF